MSEERRPRVLVVDDEARVRGLLSDMLAIWGCQAVEAESSDTALALFDQGEYDLVLTDFLMPGRNGLELIRDVRSRDAGIGVIMFTASAADFDADCRQLEFTVLRKPLQLEGLKSAVEQALRGRTRTTPAALS
jgi:DNA-binding NtrC family response regulator